MRDTRPGIAKPEFAPQFKGLADPTRLTVLARLSSEPVCVCELAAGLKVPQPLLSFHLRSLREAGLVRVTRRGRWSYYALDGSAIDVLAGFLADLAAASRTPAAGACCGVGAAQ